MATDAPAITQPPATAERLFAAAWAYLQLDPADLAKITGNFATFRDAWHADAAALCGCGVSARTAAGIGERRRAIRPENLVAQLDRAGLRLCTIVDPDYPPLLKRIHDPPPALFYRGRIATLGPTLAVVGTRRASDYGQQVTAQLCRPLAAAGITIVSGLALGVDTIAHRTALEAGGRTVAVLGGGADDATLYPPANRKLAGAIAAAGGAVVSEYPPATAPLPYRFPQRNRVIAGMSLGTLVIEAPQKSGALITARAAIEENREVLAVPGRISDENAAGPLELIATGATMVRNAADVCAALGLDLPAGPARAAAARPADHAAVLAALAQPLPREALQQRCKLAPPQLSSALTQLEVSGAIRRLPSGKFYRTDVSL